MKRRIVALLGVVLGGCNLDASGQGDDGTSEGSSTTPGASESEGTDPSAGSGTSSGGAIDGSGTTGDSVSSTGAGTTDGMSSDEGSSTGEPPAVLCPDRAELAACWDFADVGGGMLWDASGNDNHGTATGVSVVPGPFGEAAAFDDDSEVSVPDSASLDIAGDLTIEAWLEIEALPEGGRVGILDKDGQYSLMLYADQGYRCHILEVEAFAPAPGPGAWTHVACVYDGAALRIYVDGTEENELPASGAIPTDSLEPMSIGDTSPTFNEPLDGAIGGVRVWSRALDSAELCEAAGPACTR